MARNYLKDAVAETPQSEQENEKQVKNSAGGFSFKLDSFERLKRFLILGSEGGTYYIGERQLTKENVSCLKQCVKEDGYKTLQLIEAISVEGRAPKNDPAIFALAYCFSIPELIPHAREVLPKVCRIGTHLFQFVEYVQLFRGWGRGLRDAVSDWYLGKEEDQLAYQLAKYQQRNGWSHKDVLRKAHVGHANRASLRWAIGANTQKREVTRGEGDQATTIIYPKTGSYPGIIKGYMAAHKAKSADEVADLVREYNLSREMIPTEHLSNPVVLNALLDKMPITALIRNLGNLTRHEVLKPLGSRVGEVVEKIINADIIRKGRVHPIQFLMAQMTYGAGQGVRGSSTWTPIQPIVDALEVGFYTAFNFVEPTNKRILIGLDISGSMGGFYGYGGYGSLAGVPGLTPAMASAALCMVTARVEKQYHVMGFATSFIDLGITARDSLQTAMNKAAKHTMGGTDCALPMIWALQNNVECDAFFVYTDNETWAGNIHPHKALEKYRKQMGIDVKLVVVGMTATDFSIANPDDPGMLDVVGFDSAVPNLMAEFIS